MTAVSSAVRDSEILTHVTNGLRSDPRTGCIHLPGKFVDTPDAILLDRLAGRVQWQTVEAAERIDLTPVLADILILKRDMIRPVGTPALPFAARIKALARHHEFRNAANGLADPARFLGSELAGAETVTL